MIRCRRVKCDVNYFVIDRKSGLLSVLFSRLDCIAYIVFTPLACSSADLSYPVFVFLK